MKVAFPNFVLENPESKEFGKYYSSLNYIIQEK